MQNPSGDNTASGKHRTSSNNGRTRTIEAALPASECRPLLRQESELSHPLTTVESAKLDDCEQVIEIGLGTFHEVGIALLTIREDRLYRSQHSTFEQYCLDRWNIGRSYASRVMGAAQRIKLLNGDTSVPRPKNEFQMRPFLKLSPEDFPKAWKQAVKTAKDGRVTSSAVDAVIDELLPERETKIASKRRANRKQRTKLPEGQILVLLNEAKQYVEKGDTDKTLATLERIENLLFGT